MKSDFNAIMLRLAAVFTATFLQPPHVTTAQADQAKAEIVVNGTNENSISDLLAGTNLHLSMEARVGLETWPNDLLTKDRNGSLEPNADMVRKMISGGVHLLRYPGGETANFVHWRDGVGAVPERLDFQDEFRRPRTHNHGTLEFAGIAEAVGAAMIITANYKTGSPQEAANWVEFCNAQAPPPRPEWSETSYRGDEIAPQGYFAWLRARLGRAAPLSVRYWEVGNEVYFHKDNAYLSKAESFARAMKLRDPSVRVYVSADSLLYVDKSEYPTLRAELTKFDGIVVHYYGSVRTRKPLTRFYTNATSSRNFDLPATGDVRFDIEAFGSKGIDWPILEVRIDDRVVATLRVSSTTPRNYGVEARLEAGRHTIAFALTNDSNIPLVGDTNLYVRGASIEGAGLAKREFWATPRLEYDWLYADNRHLEEHLMSIRRAFPGLPIAVTEGNTGYGISPGNMDAKDSRKLKAALWVAGLLNSLIRNDVSIFTQWALQDRHMGFGLVLEDGHLSPTYHVMRAYAVHGGRRKVDLDVNSPTFDTPLLETTPFGRASTGNPYVDAVASLAPDGRDLTITVVNRHATDAIETTVNLGKMTADGSLSGEVIDAADGKGLEADNEIDHQNVKARPFTSGGMVGREVRMSLPAHSIATLRVGLAH